VSAVKVARAACKLQGRASFKADRLISGATNALARGSSVVL